MTRSHRKDIAAIYLVVGFSTLLLVVGFYLLGMRPLIGYLRDSHTQSIELALQNSVGRLETALRDYENLARQTASRTAIRLKQAAYLRGELPLDTLIAFSQPKLADALNANTDLVAIVRYDPDGQRLYAVGKPVPPEFDAACHPGTLEAVEIASTGFDRHTNRLIYCSPLLDPEHGRLGADLLVLHDHAIQTLVDEQSQPPYTLALVVNGSDIGYWPNRPGSSGAREALEQYLTQGISDPRFVIRQLPVNSSGWTLASIVNAEQFFAPINQQSFVLTMTSLGAALTTFLLTLLALRPIVAVFNHEERLLVLAQTDRLTGLTNHVHMQELMDSELARADRYGHPLVLIFFDIDHFKLLNDQCGHQAGDRALVDLAALCRGQARETDHLARYGGEEFLLILPETSHADGLDFAERLRQTIEATLFKVAGNTRQITVSMGVASWNGRRPAPSKHDLINRADEALYRSKAEGRNRVTDGGSPIPDVGDALGLVDV